MKQLTALAIAMILLFVVVCLLTPPPTSTVGVKNHSPHVNATAPAFVLVLALISASMFMTRRANDAYAAMSPDIVELTCKRLC